MTSTFYSAESLKELRERVGYEDSFLESAYKLAEGGLFPEWPDEVIYEPNATAPAVTRYSRAHIEYGDWRPGFLEAGAPLLFTTAFKVLDALFEWILERNGRQAGFRFVQKLQQLEAPGLHYPNILASRPWLVERLKGLYKETEPLRGTIIHSRHFKSSNGTLRVAGSKRGVVGEEIELGPSELRRFAQILVSVLRFLQGDWALSEHRDKSLRWQLDRLVKLHKLDVLGQREPRHIRVRWYTEDPLIQNIDVDRLRRDLEAQNPGHDITFDLRVVVLEGQTTVEAYLIPYEHLPQLTTLEDSSCFRCDLPA